MFQLTIEEKTIHIGLVRTICLKCYKGGRYAVDNNLCNYSYVMEVKEI